MSWCTVESDPGVFTELISSIGVQGVQVEELYDLELEHLLSLQPVYGLIFLFKYVAEDLPTVEEGRQLVTDEAAHSQVFFARQVVQNACATQAIVSVLLNRPELELGPQLSSFKDFTSSLPADLRGEAIGNSEFIRTAHNAFARPEPFVFDEKKDEQGEAEDAFHFIGYVPVGGELYELDGLKPAPITLGSVQGGASGSEWLRLAKQSIERRVDKYADKEIRFNLLAIVRNRKQVLQEHISSIRKRKQELQQQQPADADTVMADAASAASASAAAGGDSAAELLRLEQEEADAERLLAEEEVKYGKWRVENARRQHNYVPFIFNVLKLLAEKGQLNDLVEAAAKVTAEKNARLIANRQKKREEEKKAKAASKSKAASAAAPSTASGSTAAAQGDTKPK